MQDYNIEFVELFLKYGADINNKNNEGESALSIAQKYPELLKLLSPKP